MGCRRAWWSAGWRWGPSSGPGAGWRWPSGSPPGARPPGGRQRFEALSAREDAMTTKSAPATLKQPGEAPGTLEKADQGPYERHLVFDHVVAVEEASQRERFEAV